MMIAAIKKIGPQKMGKGLRFSLQLGSNKGEVRLTPF